MKRSWNVHWAHPPCPVDSSFLRERKVQILVTRGARYIGNQAAELSVTPASLNTGHRWPAWTPVQPTFPPECARHKYIWRRTEDMVGVQQQTDCQNRSLQ